MSANAASVFATAFFAELIRQGLRDVVLSPGSRSQALALAAAEFERAKLLRVHLRIDERSAGFLALGLALESGVPVAVVTTSGTAVANLHPAVLEAAHAGVPLLILSADRPANSRGVGANQTTQQAGIFSYSAPVFWDVSPPNVYVDQVSRAEKLAREVLDGISRPRQVNLAFAEPLSAPVPLPAITPGLWLGKTAGEEIFVLDPEPGTVVVAGTGAGAHAESVAREAGVPLLAEVSSGARFGPNLVAAYRELLELPEFSNRVRRVIIFGHPTLSRHIPKLIARPDVTSVVVRGSGLENYNPTHRVSRFVDRVSVNGSAQDTGWVKSWVHTSRALLAGKTEELVSISTNLTVRAAFARAQLAQMRAPLTRRTLVEGVWNATWPHDRLVLGASRLIRELDGVAPGKNIRVYANRGLSGIDGTVATGIGVALALEYSSSRSGITRVLLGDLSFLHDVGSLFFGFAEPRPPIQLVVGNDGGGTIFDTLEVADTADPKLFDRVLYTPHAVDLSALAAAYGWEHRLVSERGQLDGALSPSPGAVLVEVKLERGSRAKNSSLTYT